MGKSYKLETSEIIGKCEKIFKNGKIVKQEKLQKMGQIVENGKNCKTVVDVDFNRRGAILGIACRPNFP